MGQLSIKTDEKETTTPGKRSMLALYFRRKFSRNYQDYGLWISGKKAMAYLLQPLYQKIIYYLYELDLNKYVGQDAHHDDFIFRLIDHNDQELIDQIETMEEWLSGVLKRKLQDNCLCMVVLDGDRVIGFNYVAIGEGYIPLLRLRVVTGPTQAWSEQISISSDYRRRGLASALRNHFYAALRARGITSLYGHRQIFNIASEHSARKYTRGVMVRAEYKRILGRQVLKCTQPHSQGPETEKSFYIKAQVMKNPGGSNIGPAAPPPPVFTTRIEALK